MLAFGFFGTLQAGNYLEKLTNATEVLGHFYLLVGKTCEELKRNYIKIKQNVKILN